MKTPKLFALLAVVLCLALPLAACGSSSHHHRVAKAVVAGGVAHHVYKKHKEKQAAAAGYRPGEFCSKSKKHTYRKYNLKCVHGRLQRA